MKEKGVWIRILTIAALWCMSLSLSGCSEFLKSPMEMIKRPQLEINQQRALEVIQQAISPSAKLISPLISEDLSSVNMVDIDNDDSKEVIAFYSVKESFRIGFVILERNDEGFYVDYKQDDIGNDLIYAKIDNLSGMGRFSLVLGLQGAEGTLKNISIFSYRDGKYYQSYKSVYSDIIIEDFDLDGRDEIFLISTNRENISTAQLLKETHGAISIMDIVNLDPNIKGYDNIHFGYAMKDQGAIFMDFSLGTSLAATEILLIENMRLRTAFYHPNSVLKYEKTLKSEMIVSQDIDGDGIIEIGKLVTQPTSENHMPIDTSRLTGWYKWDGKEGINLFRVTYDDPDGVYRFQLPSRWKTDVSVYSDLTEQNYRRVQFQIQLDPSLTFKLFEIITVPADQFSVFSESLSEKNIVYYLLGRSNGFVYVGLYEESNQNIPEEYVTKYRNLTLTDSEIRENFKLLNP